LSKSKILTENKILRLKIDDSWTSNDFINLFNSLNIIYKILLELEFIDKENRFLQKYLEENKIPKNTKLHEQGLEFETLRDIQIIDGELYKRLNYSSVTNNSELIKDFRQEFTKTFLADDRMDNKSFKVRQIKYSSPGFADLIGIGKIVEQIFNMFKYYFPNKETDLKNSLLEQDLISKKIDNLKSIGFSEKELQKFLDVRNSSILNIKNLKISDKITKVEIKEIE
tara:strand:+ start:32 stop:709 length:678 start_codon:yes stop_codon:yes gene_type:complete